MESLKLIRYLIIIVFGMTFTNCTSEYAPIPGQNGIDGIDGIDGLDTSAEGCISCHSNSHRDPIYAAYETSVHSKGLTEGVVNYAGARTACARCHSSEGFTDFMDNGFVNPTGYYGTSEPEIVLINNDNGTPLDPSDDFLEPELDDFGAPVYSNNPVPVVNPISCVTCHDTHKSFDFENDGNDYALRGLDAVTLITDGTIIDYGNRSNNCINCHQPRKTGPIDDGTGNFTVTSPYWGPHYGAQATLLEGIQGALIPGSEGYPGVASSAHRSGASCVNCHMGETESQDPAGHSFIPDNINCTSCHENGVPTEVTGLLADMTTLAGLLDTVGIVQADKAVRGTFTIEEAQAAWNYILILEDASNGIHNPEYSKALIKNSIEALQN